MVGAFSSNAMHLRIADDVAVRTGTRPHHVVFGATEGIGRAEVEVSVTLAELVRFGITV